MPKPLHLLLVDAHETRRAAFIDLLAQCPAVGEVRMSASLDNALEQLEGLDPDMLVVSLDALDESVTEALLVFLRHTARPVLLIAPECELRSALTLVQNGIADILTGTPESLQADAVAAAIQNSRAALRARQQNEVLARAVMRISDCVCVTDPQNKIVAVNDSFCRTYGYGREQITGQAIDGLLPHVFSCAEEDSPDIYHTNSSGGLFPVTVSWSEVRTPGGKLLSNVAVIRDISRQKRTEDKLKTSLKEKEVLLKEIHHRVKNNLQVISSLLNLQSSFSEDANIAEALRDSQNRVRSMALIHELLYRSGSLNEIDFKEYIRSLVSHVSGSYRFAGNIAIEIEIADVLFNVDFAIPCGLIVNELLSNSLKHAFPYGGPGKIRIELRPDELDGAPAMSLLFSDDGVGLPKNIDMESSRSLGLQLIKMLTQQLKGQLATTSGNGLQYTITFPA